MPLAVIVFLEPLLYPAYDSETGALIYRIVPDSHSHAESVSEIVTETESSASGVTIQSDDVPEFFIEHYGRQQPASENAVRWFPADDTKRYILRHVVNRYQQQNYGGPVREMLSSDPGPGKCHQVLEIGTRDGTWTQEMATEFPHVQFRSLDIAPIMAHAPRSNIAFEVYDITEGLILEDDSQDIVFVNLAIELIRDYRALLREVHRVLRPGGLIHIREYVPGLWDSCDETQFARRTNPIGCRLFDTIRSIMTKFGADPDMCEKLPAWLAPGSDLWQDSNGLKGFERINRLSKVWSIYPHYNHPCSSKLDPRYLPLIQHLFVICIRGSSGILRDGGLSEEEAGRLIEAVIEEAKDPEKCTLFKVYTVYAIKTAEH